MKGLVSEKARGMGMWSSELVHCLSCAAGVRQSRRPGGGPISGHTSPFPQITREPSLRAEGWGPLPSDSVWNINCYLSEAPKWASLYITPTATVPSPAACLCSALTDTTHILHACVKAYMLHTHPCPFPTLRPRFLCKRKVAALGHQETTRGDLPDPRPPSSS